MPTGYEIGCTMHMRGWQCPNDTFDLAAARRLNRENVM
jgi:hypothetical protein